MGVRGRVTDSVRPGLPGGARLRIGRSRGKGLFNKCGLTAFSGEGGPLDDLGRDALSGMGEPCGTWGSGRRAFRMLRYVLAGLLSLSTEWLRSERVLESVMPSLSPLRCPKAEFAGAWEPLGPMEPTEACEACVALLESVLDRLGVPLEYIEEPVEAVDVWRSGEGDGAGWSPGRFRGEYDG